MSVREIKALHRAFAEAAVRHDLEAIASVFASDAIIMPPDAEMVEGRDAILQHWKGAFDGGLSGLELNPTSIKVMGDMAVEIGHPLDGAGRCGRNPRQPQVRRDLEEDPRPVASLSRHVEQP